MSSPLLPWEEGLHADESLIKATLLEHQLEVIGSIGFGSYAGVYACRSLRYDHEFVAKVSLHDGSCSPESSTEIKVLKTIVHPHVVAIYDAFSDDSFLYVILEYCRGGSLKTLISEVGAIHPPRLYTLCLQIADALHECHRHRIAHQDIKPANVLLDSYVRPKVADFGLSHQFDGPTASTGCRVGSLAFMAPEILTGSRRDAFRCDVWSLGVTFYYMAVGQMPWQAESSVQLEGIIKSGVYQVPAGVSMGFRAVLRKMLTVDPNQRASLESIIEELSAVVQEASGEKGGDGSGRLTSRRSPIVLSRSGSWGNGLRLLQPGRRMSAMKGRSATFASSALVE
jgi:serine/threonine protein kinase